MSKYQSGKIYKITSDKHDKIYVGSTTQILQVRLGQHYLAVKTFENGNCNRCSSQEVLDETSKIILLEDFPCSSKKELETRERYWIEELKEFCVNKQTPALNTWQTKDHPNYQLSLEKSAQRKRENRDKILPVEREYRKNNAEKVAEWKKKYAENHKEQISEYQKKFREENKEKIREYQRKYYQEKRTKQLRSTSEPTSGAQAKMTQ